MSSNNLPQLPNNVQQPPIKKSNNNNSSFTYDIAWNLDAFDKSITFNDPTLDIHIEAPKYKKVVFAKSDTALSTTLQAIIDGNWLTQQSDEVFLNKDKKRELIELAFTSWLEKRNEVVEFKKKQYLNILKINRIKDAKNLVSDKLTVELPFVEESKEDNDTYNSLYSGLKRPISQISNSLNNNIPINPNGLINPNQPNKRPKNNPDLSTGLPPDSV